MKKGDFLSVAAVLFLCALWFVLTASTGDSLVAEIYSGGEKVREIPISKLNNAETFSFGGCEITAEKNRIYFAESSCKDKLCIKTGELTRAGDVAACVPNRVVVALKSESKNDFDIVTY